MLKYMVLLVISCTSVNGFSQKSVSDHNVLLEEIISTHTLHQPTSMEFVGPDDILVGEFCGNIKRVHNGETTLVTKLPASCSGEAGFVYLLRDSDFANTKSIYCSYIKSVNGTSTYQISRFRWTGVELINEQIVTSISLIGGQHVGGAMAFGPPNLPPSQQKLFIVVGDQGVFAPHKSMNYATGPEPADASMILRINRDGSIPSGTERGPFYDVAGNNESMQKMYAYGIRNSYGLGFDPVSNHLWDTENGVSFHDEINLVTPGMNSGWRRISGPSSRSSSFEYGSDLDDLVYFGNPPVGEYSDPEFSFISRSWAPTAILFYNSDALGPQYRDSCFVGAYNGGVYHFPMRPDRLGFDLQNGLADDVLDLGDDYRQILFLRSFSGTTDLRIGPDGLLYILFFDDGTIGRLKPATTSVSDWGIY